MSAPRACDMLLRDTLPRGRRGPARRRRAARYTGSGRARGSKPSESRHGRRGRSREGIRPRWNRSSSPAAPDSSARTSCGSRSRDTDARVVVLDTLTYAGNLASLRRRRASTRASRSCRATSPIARRSRRCSASTGRTRSSTSPPRPTSTARSTGRGAFVETNVVGTFELLEADAPAPRRTLAPDRAGALPLPARLDRRGVRLARPGGRVRARRRPYAPNSPYAASKAGADHLVRAYHETYGAAGARHELLEQLRALPVPGEADPAHDPERASRAGRCPSTATAATCATGSTSRITARRCSWSCGAGLPGAPLQRGRGRTSGRTSRSWTRSARRSSRSGPRRGTPRSPRGGRPLRRPPDASSPIGPATTAATRSTRRGSGPSSAGARSIGFEDGLRATVAWYLEHRDWCDAVLGDRYGRERLGLGQRPAGG